MAKDQGASAPPARRSKGTAKPATSARPKAASAVEAARAPAPPKAPFNPTQFFREVRTEARRITWTSWKETWITSVMVFIMVVVTSLFFLVVDGVLGFLVQQLPLLESWIANMTHLAGPQG